MTDLSEERILRRLSPGDADPILVADFQAMSMAPRLSEMLSEHIPGRAVFQIDPIGMLSEDRLYVPLPELAAACVEELYASGAGAGAALVIGHCSAAPLALRVASLLTPARSVTAVLVNPTWPDDDHVMEKYAEFLAKFGYTTCPAPDLDLDPKLVVSAMEQVLLDEVIALAARRGITSSAGALSDLTVWYRAWLAFLLASRNDKQIGGAARQVELTALTDSPSTLMVPGRAKDGYLVRELPPQPVGMVTPELAEMVAAYVSTSATGQDNDPF
jgi:hypothetical protein